MKIQKLSQLRELIKEGWKLGNIGTDAWHYTGVGSNTERWLKTGRYRLKSPQGDIIPVEYCKGDLDEHTFKVGDLVRCKPGYDRYVGYGSVNYGGAGYDSGFEVTIKEVDHDMVTPVDQGGGIYTRALELVEAKTESIPDRVGWKVRCKDIPEYGEGVIISMNGTLVDKWAIRFSGILPKYIDWDRLERVVEESLLEKAKPTSGHEGFEVGDTVRLVSTSSMSAKYGAKAVVMESDGVPWLQVKWLDELARGQRDGGYRPDIFKVIEHIGDTKPVFPVEELSDRLYEISRGQHSHLIKESDTNKQEQDGYYSKDTRKTEDKQIDEALDKVLRGKRDGSLEARIRQIKDISETSYC